MHLQLLKRSLAWKAQDAKPRWLVRILDVEDLYGQLQRKVHSCQERNADPERIACAVLARRSDPVGAPPEEDPKPDDTCSTHASGQRLAP